MSSQLRNTLIAGLAVGAAAVSLYFALAGRSPKVDLSPYAALGAVTAEETAKLLGGQGRILVIARDTGAESNPSVDAELKAFGQTLKQHAGLSRVTEKIRGTPMLMMATGGGVPAEQLFSALETHGNVGALVLFCSLPSLADPELDALKRRGLKTVVVSSYHPDYGRLLEQQVIHLAIVPRSGEGSPSAQRPRTVRERFDQDYTIVTPADVTGLR